MTGPQGMGPLMRVLAPAEYSSIIENDGPIAYYRLEETSGTNVNDEIGIFADGTSSGVTQGVFGASDNAFAFDGVNDYFTGQLYGAFGSTVTQSSWELWLNTNSTVGSYVFGTVNNNNAGNPIVQMILNTGTSVAGELSASSQRLGFVIRLSDGRTRKWYSNALAGVFDGEWHHIVWVISTISDAVLYIDGVATTLTFTSSGSGSGGAADFEFPVAFAARNLRGVIGGFCACGLDEVAIYDYELTEEQVEAHFNGWMDDPGDMWTVLPLGGISQSGGSPSNQIVLVDLIIPANTLIFVIASCGTNTAGTPVATCDDVTFDTVLQFDNNSPNPDRRNILIRAVSGDDPGTAITVTFPASITEKMAGACYILGAPITNGGQDAYVASTISTNPDFVIQFTQVRRAGHSQLGFAWGSEASGNPILGSAGSSTVLDHSPIGAYAVGIQKWVLGMLNPSMTLSGGSGGGGILLEMNGRLAP